MNDTTVQLKAAIAKREASCLDTLRNPIVAGAAAIQNARQEAEQLLSSYRLMKLTETDPDVLGEYAEVEEKLGALLREAGRAEQAMHRVLETSQGIDRLIDRLP